MKNSKRHFKVYTEDTYNVAKKTVTILTDLGMTQGDIAKAIGRSDTTVMRIRQSTDFASYLQQARDWTAKYRTAHPVVSPVTHILVKEETAFGKQLDTIEYKLNKLLNGLGIEG